MRWLASNFARSWGSKLQAVRTWRTIEGFAAKGNSPGTQSPAQCLTCRTNDDRGEVTRVAVMGCSGMLQNWIVPVPLVVASILGTAQLLCSALFVQLDETNQGSRTLYSVINHYKLEFFI